MPALTITTDSSRSRSRSTSSPTRPPMSPITPPLAPAKPPDIADHGGGAAAADAAIPPLPPPRRPLTHTTQPSHQIGIPPPPPEPIDFESNPDVIALRSAISVLQVQKNRATGDIRDLNKIRHEALDEPEAFIRDLIAGKVKAKDSFAALDEDEDEDEENGCKTSDCDQRERAWCSLPRAQDVVRCPPVNWAQYAVVGESLDKLHADQISRPSTGVPAVFGSSGLYDIKGEGKQEKYPGVAAPYAPGKDVIDRKAKGKK